MITTSMGNKPMWQIKQGNLNTKTYNPIHLEHDQEV